MDRRYRSPGLSSAAFLSGAAVLVFGVYGAIERDVSPPCQYGGGAIVACVSPDVGPAGTAVHPGIAQGFVDVLPHGPVEPVAVMRQLLA